jgi:methyl-accepting chemotaxis protein
MAFNESVGNLQEFNALLRETLAKLDEQTRSLEAGAGSLQQRESQTAASLDELNSAVEQMENAFESQGTQAATAVERVTAASTEGGESRLPAAQQDVDEQATALEQALGRDGDELEAAWSELEGGGFKPTEGVLTSLAAEAETLRQGAEQVFDEADGELAEARQEADGAHAAADGAVAAFAADAAGQQDAAQQVAQLATTLEQSTSEVDSAVGAVASDMDQAYATLAQEAGEATAGFVTDVSALIESTGTGIDEDGREVEQGVSEVGEGASAELVSTLTQADTLVTAGETATEPCATLVPELARSRDIAAEIDRLLQAMA